MKPSDFLRHRFPVNVPLRTILIVPFVLQILGAVGLVGYLSFLNGRQAVNELARQLRSEMSARVEGELKSYLDSPHRFNRVNAATLAKGQFDMAEASNAVQFLRQLEVTDFAFAAYCGDEQGRYLGVSRFMDGNRSKIVLDASNADSRYNLTSYNMNVNGNKERSLKQYSLFDPRKRPWYEATGVAKRPIWTEVYLDFTTGLPTITASEPVYGQNNRLLGVCATDVVLLQEFRKFLANLSIGNSGIAFVMDRSGALLSSSTDELLTRGEGEKMTLLQATDSSSPLIQETAQYLQEQFGGFSRIQQAQQLDFRLDDDRLSLAGERQFVQVLPFKDNRGLDWLIVIAIPESDFMSQIYANTRNTILLCIAALVAATAIGILNARWITKPLLELNSAAKDIAKGELDRTVAIQRSDEVGELARSFNNMAAQLQGSFEVLEIKNAELQHLDKLKDEFLANTSHELRTPLNGMIGIAESMIDGATGKLTELQERNLWMVAQSGHRLANLVNDILDFSKLKHQNIELQLKPVSLREVVEVVLTLSRPLLGSKKLQIVNAVSSDLPSAKADENRLQQILHNLVGNAVKFTSTGTVKVSAELRHQETGQQLAITVSDTGIGIPADKLDRIFEAFEQAEGATAREYGGTGLGLAVTKQLVELHHGRLSVKSTVGAGSQFTFTLPVSETEENQALEVGTAPIQRVAALAESLRLASSPPSPDVSIPPQSTGCVVLIVDDEPVNLQVLVNHLSLQDYSIVQASNGEEALKLIDQGVKPAIVLLDVMMPKMTGYEVTQRLRERYAATDLPIVLLTAKTQVSDLVVGLNVGANDYLTKPISRDELLARIRTHLNLSQLREALRLEESKYRIMFENAIEGIFQSSPEGQFLRVNPAYAQLLGYESPEELLAEVQEISQQIYVEGERRNELKRLLMEQGEIRDFEYEAYRRDRSKIWVSVWARVVRDSQGNVLYYEGTCIDITQRKQKEETLKQQLQELQFEIDHSQRARQVAAITKTNYFQRLLADADELRYSDDTDN
ncbi:MAG: ATP-binding protein [Oculatellaceae cyanobacterium Prado106]|nr:ATP-binding protein [Oculatellaceae cyanobacterium Prado106]